jgi:hypothetical protein
VHVRCWSIAIASLAALSACPPSGARTCSSNADCQNNEVCVVVEGAGTCGTPTVPDPADDAGVPLDAGPSDDAGPDPDDAGPDPDDAGPDPQDAGAASYSLTARPSTGASTSEGDTLKLRARVRSAEVPAPMTGGTFKLSPPRN